MYNIYKITSNPTVDFAAEELKKYLRMMMPYAGEITIKYAPEAVDGFRLGLMADFGLDTSEARNVELDDILHIDTDAEGGIIAGDNPRSVLLAVYEYLRRNGCRNRCNLHRRCCARRLWNLRDIQHTYFFFF